MSHVEQTKHEILQNLNSLCAHCSRGVPKHSCPIQRIRWEVKAISGVPLMVNNEFRGLMWS